MDFSGWRHGLEVLDQQSPWGCYRNFAHFKIPVKAQGPQANTKKISSVYYQNLLVPLGQKIKFHR